MDKKIVLTILILIGIVVGVIYIILDEVVEAKNECEKLGGNYNLKFSQGHLCNQEKFNKKSVCRFNECKIVWYYETNFIINASEFLE